MNRISILRRIDDLSEDHCKPCTKPKSECAACGIDKEIKGLGNLLLEKRKNTQSTHTEIGKILAKGDMITWKEVDRLFELGVEKKKIYMAMNMTSSEFFKAQKRRGVLVETKKEKKELVKESYFKLKEERVPDSMIAKQHGMSSVQMTAWRQTHLTTEEKEKTRLKKGGNTLVERAEAPVVSVVPEKSPAPDQEDVSAQVKKQIENLVKENDAWRLEKAELLEQHGEALAAKDAVISEANEALKDRDAQIGALESNVADLEQTVQRTKMELDMEIKTKQQLSEKQPLVSNQEKRMDIENKALKTLVKLYIS